MDMWSSASPRLRSGPMAASLARAVMSEPEKPDSVRGGDVSVGLWSGHKGKEKGGEGREGWSED